MSSATLTLASRALHHKIKNKVSVLPGFRINWKLVYFLGAIAVCALLVFYIFMVLQLTQGAYLIKKYNKEVGSLTAQNKTLETGFAESGFLGSVQEKAQALNFEKTTGVTYITVMSGSLAEAK